jgi:hypothetical protein
VVQLRRRHWDRSADPVLITTAPRSPDYEFTHRRRKYAVLMSLRVVCLLGAVFTYSYSLWIALLMVVGGAALPWCAVLIANDGPPRRRRTALPGVAPQPAADRELPGFRADRTIDGDSPNGTIGE